MREYDFIFAGGGLAGLSLAYHLSQSALRDASMLIIDRDAKTRNDRTWCFWTTQPTPFDSIVQREWRHIHFAGENFERVIDLDDYRYQMIRGIDFYRCARQALSARVDFLQGTVDAIDDDNDGACMRVNGATYRGNWVFDSRLNLRDAPPAVSRAHRLAQYFKGWEIETRDDVFQPDAATLLDFRAPQNDAMQFFYILPFSPRRALVEYVTLAPDHFDDALKNYLRDVLGIADYKVIATEGGVNPMTDYVFPRRAGKRVMNIGARGGRLKPSTGYAFTRIQKDSAAIVASLVAHGHPFNVPADSRRYRYYDALMLELMQSHAAQIQPIFTALFKNNSIMRVLRFLDEAASPLENLQLIATLPPQLFLQAMVHSARFNARSWTLRK